MQYAYGLSALLYLCLLSSLTNPLLATFKVLPIIILLALVWRQPIKRPQQYLLSWILTCSALGDVLLTLPGTKPLHVGIAMFLLAHLGYILSMFPLSKWQGRNLLFFSPIFLLAIALGVYLYPALQAMLVPVYLYMTVILIMVFVAMQISPRPNLLMIGALLFLGSDAILAVNLFVYPQAHWSLWIMISYYAAQWTLTDGLIKAYRRQDDAWPGSFPPYNPTSNPHSLAR